MSETRFSERVERYVRGSIWWCKDDSLKTVEMGVQHGTRPALIISNDNRGSNPTVEVLKLTTQDRADRCPGINIPVFMNGKQNYILCNQHFTVNTDSLTEFIGICPEKTMLEVENGILRALGMTQLIAMQSKYFDLTRTVQEVIDQRLSKYRALPDNETDTVVDVVSNVINGLNMMLSNAEESLKAQMVTEAKGDTESEVIETPIIRELEDTTDDEVDKIVTKSLTSNSNETIVRKGFRSYTPRKPIEIDSGVDSEEVTPQKTPRPYSKGDGELGEVGSKRFTGTTTWTVEEIDGVKFERSLAGKINWNEELAKKFIEDCDKMPLAKVCDKYGYADRKKVSSMKYVIKNKFNL